MSRRVRACMPRRTAGLVRRDRDHPEPPEPGEYARGDEACHGLPPGEPGQQRRHLQRDVLAEQFGQRARIRVLEGRGEPVEQRTLPGVGRLGQLILGGLCLGQLSAGPPQPAVDRGGRGAQQIRCLGGREFQHVPQDQYRALPGRQMLQRRDESQPDIRPRHGCRGRILPLPGQQHVRERLQPRHLRPRHQLCLRVFGGSAQPGRQRPRPRRSIAVRHTLIAIRYSQVRTDERPSNPP